MLWIVFVLLASIFWTLVHLVDKFVVDKEIKSPMLAASLYGIPASLVFLLSGLFVDKLLVPLEVIVPCLAAGIFYRAAAYFYYSAMEKEEVSRFAPSLSLSTVFAVVFGFFLLNEVFSMTVYLGIAMTIGGAFLISLEDPLKSLKDLKSKKGLIFTVIAAGLYASRSVAFKFGTNGAGFLSCLFWMGAGALFVSLLFLAMEDERIREREIKGGEHLIGVGLIGAMGFLFYGKALSLGPVSLASSVLKVKVFLVFLASTVVTKYHPEILHEEIERKFLAQKLIAIILIVGGVVLIHLFS